MHQNPPQPQGHGARCRQLVLLVLTALLAACAGEGQTQAPIALPYPAPPEEPRFYYERTIFGTADVEASTQEERLRQVLTGAPRRRGQAFSKPFDVAVHHGRIFVSDTVLNTVIVLDLQEQRTFQIGGEGNEGDLAKPLGVAVDGAGKLYVVDAGRNRVVVYTRDGVFLRAFGGEGELERPSGIDVSADGTRAYIVDVGGVSSSRHVIHVYNPKDGERITTIGERGKGKGQLNLPRDVAVSSDGLLYVSDGGNFRVQVFDSAGQYVREWGQPGMRFGQFSRPKGIGLDSQGNVYIVDTAFGNFQIFTRTGTLLLFIGERSEQNGPGVFMLPSGITVDVDGRVFVVDQFYRKLEIFRPATVPPMPGGALPQ